jgi:ArsR family transcriptional regulator
MPNKRCVSGKDPPRPQLLPTKAADDELAALTKALAHPVRVRIVRILQRQQACICGDLVDQLPLAQSTVSQHLKVLKEAGLVTGEIDGPRVCYCIDPQVLKTLKRLVEEL